MSHAITTHNHLITVTLHCSPDIDDAQQCACDELLALLDQQSHKVILLLDIRALTVDQCNTILSDPPECAIQLMFTHPRVCEILITTPDEVYRLHAKDRMYKSYNASPILLAESLEMALDYVAEWRAAH